MRPANNEIPPAVWQIKGDSLLMGTTDAPLEKNQMISGTTTVTMKGS